MGEQPTLSFCDFVEYWSGPVWTMGA